MKNIYIHTCYPHLVKEIIEKYQIQIQEEKSMFFNENQNLSIFKIIFDKKVMDFLIELLEKMILLNNPVIESEILKTAIIKNVFMPIRSKITSDLNEYMKENTIINLEGYYKFRMENHNTQMYSMLYNIIKKHLDI